MYCQLITRLLQHMYVFKGLVLRYADPDTILEGDKPQREIVYAVDSFYGTRRYDYVMVMPHRGRDAYHSRFAQLLVLFQLQLKGETKDLCFVKWFKMMHPVDKPDRTSLRLVSGDGFGVIETTSIIRATHLIPHFSFPADDMYYVNHHIDVDAFQML